MLVHFIDLCVLCLNSCGSSFDLSCNNDLVGQVSFCQFVVSNFQCVFSLLRQTSSYFQQCAIFLSCTHQFKIRKSQRNHVRFTGKCMLYSLCQLPPEFSMLFLFKINNSLYLSFQSFINTQILTISHIIIHNNLHAIHKNTELLF